MATESELRYNAAHFLDDYKGISEGGTKHRHLIDMFNDSGKCTRYKVTYTDAWCAVAFCDCFIGTGLEDLIPIDCGCAELVTKAKAMDIWVEDDAYVPQMGDGIEYDWQDTTGSKSDNTGTPDHIGMVQSVNKNAGTFEVIEGNKSDTVGIRTMSINGKYIRGFITPDYAKAASGGSTGTTSGTKSGTTGSTGSTGSTGTTSSSSGTLTVDGQIGAKTVTKLQKVMGTTQDGFIDGQPSSGKKYWTAILSSVCKWTGGSSDVVKALQKYLINKGYSCGSSGSDGKLGQNTAKGLQKFLIAKGYSCGSSGADGYIGSNSAKALQKWLNAQ